jgi:hypothetical protein
MFDLGDFSFLLEKKPSNGCGGMLIYCVRLIIEIQKYCFDSLLIRIQAWARGMSSEVFNLARAGWWSLVVVVIQNFRNTHVIIFAKLNKKAVHKHNQT